ncbi:MAG: TonB-dependent receptor [Kofleriaceae bacterium]|nr:TonB-dependent receptor [Kofleriaceae bacterium]
MRNAPVSILVAAGLLGGAAQLVLVEGDALAQSSTSGAVRGVIKDKASKEPVIGATVVIQGPALQGQQAEITDENGSYTIQSLPPGQYTITVFYNEAQFSRPNIVIQLGKQIVVNVDINTSEAAGETIVVEGHAPIIDQGSTKTGPTITKEYTDNIPVGRTFGAVLGAAPGSQGDTYGISFGGSTSAENTYIVEGVNTTDTAYGLLSSNLPNEFVEETEVITGGYNAEFGRSTGGVINVVTKQGGNDLHGSVFAYFTPGALVAASDTINREGSSIDSESNLNYAWDLGAEVGGPIIKDKLWFHVGFNPSFNKTTYDRIISKQVDNNGDGVADVNPDTGFTEVQEITRSELPSDYKTYFFTAKINGAVNENHQFQVSAWGNPRNATDLFAITSAPTRRQYKFEDGAYDGSLKWTSKFGEGKTQIDVVGGWHRGFSRDLPLNAAGEDPRLFYRFTLPLEYFSAFEDVPSDCMDPDPNDGFEPCPVTNYSLGGLGFYERRTNDRQTGSIAVTQRVKAGGYHTIKAGLELERTTYNSDRGYTGGELFEQFSNLRWRRRTFLQFTEGDGGAIDCLDGIDTNGDGVTDITCDVIDALKADSHNRNLGAYAQDSWQLRPNLTLNAGLRWEQQIGYFADGLEGKLTPEGEVIPAEAFKLNNMLAPRVGVIYDPTQEGRAKVFGHWGRFYESVPMDINTRAFGGEITYFERTPVGNGTCADPAAADMATSVATITDCGYSPQAILGAGTEYVTPGLKGQHLDEFIVGGEYELMPDFKVGLNYVHRNLPVAIEDISTDGGNTYIITNPGEDLSSQADDLRAQADDLMATDPALADVYRARAGYLDAVRQFDKPIRNYDAIQLTANQRFSKNALLLASYTYSRSVGNYPGLFSTETGQLDPNLTSLYDLPDLMANRYGALGLDRPHNLKIDGFYSFDLKDAGLVVLGGSFRAQSGLAQNTLAAHVFYGTDESYLLPRGQIDRGPLTWQADVKGTYGRKFGNTKVEGFIDVFNLFNNQAQTHTDESYTFESVNPIVGGDLEDLAHAKSLDSGGFSTPVKNKNFGNTTSHQAPLSVRFGLRVTF